MSTHHSRIWNSWYSTPGAGSSNISWLLRVGAWQMTWADTHLCTLHNTLRGMWVTNTSAQVEYRSQCSSGYLHPVKQSSPCPAGRLCLNSTPHCTAVFHAFSAQLCRKLTLAPRAWWLLHRPILGHFHMNFFPSLLDTYWRLRWRLCINHSSAPL